MNNFHKYTRITIALVGALVMAEFLMQDVFVAGTPRVRPDLADHLVNQTMALINIDNYVAFFTGRRNANIANDPYTPTIVKGVYAQETESTSVLEIRVDEVDWTKVPYTKKDGTTIMLKIPAGTQPPAPGLF